MSGESQDNPLTVSALATGLKTAVEGRFSKIYVEAEISNWRVYPSGHAYFRLKDAGAQISAVMFKGHLARCRARDSLKDGAKVLVYANASVYPARGECQLIVMAARPTGEGELMRRYLELKARLEAEGLFDPAKKRRLPFLPRRIGIVTSPAGAVIHDMCRVLTRRFPNIEIRLYPSSVQGEDAARTLAAGVRHFDAAVDGALPGGPDPWVADVVIVARGGGSFEDLFCFNSESLVRAIAASRIPVVSAVGHETDYTLCDFAADVRAGTPSIAAELVVPVLSELTGRISKAVSSLASSLRGRYETQAQRTDALSVRLGNALWRRETAWRKRLDAARAGLSIAAAGARARCDRAGHAVERLAASLAAALEKRLAADTAKVSELSAKLSLLSPYSVLDRGYSITVSSAGEVLKDASAVRPGDTVTTRLAAGSFSSVVASRP